MKILALLFLLTFSSSFLFAQTQAEMNDQSYRTYKKADSKLTSIYEKLLVEYQADTVFITNLKKAQTLWTEFRDAQLAMKYPKREEGRYGSVQPMCVATYLTDLTRDRITTLKTWLSGIEEGDVCIGSVKKKREK